MRAPGVGPGTAPVVAAVLLSGAGALAYQVAWTRQVASITSATVTAQALVLAAFMAGLGIGAALAGRWARRLQRPILGYALAEAGVFCLALVSPAALAATHQVRTAAERIAGGHGLLVQLAAVGLFLAIPASLMGMSLPFAIEHATRGRAGQDHGRTLGWLYALNTLGAVAGASFAGFVTIEAVGLTATIRIGAVATALAAAVTFPLARRPLEPPLAAEPGPAEAPSAVLVVAAFLGGFVGMAAEVVWTRLVALVSLNTVYAFTQVLVVTLAGVAAGGVLAAGAARRAAAHTRGEIRIAALLQALGAAALAAVPVVLGWLARSPLLERELARGAAPAPLLLLGVLLVPSVACVAAVLPLLAIAHRRDPGAGASFGRLFAANTAGGVAGSLAAGFLLLGMLGSRAAWGATCAAAVLLSMLLAHAAGADRAVWRVVGLAAVAVAALVGSTDIPRTLYERRLPEGTVIRELWEGMESDVMVTDGADGRRQIWINSSWVAGAGKHRALGHLPSLMCERPRKALGIALGTGQTFAAVLRHRPERMVCVELNPGVLALARRWFAEMNDRLLEKPSVEVVNDDGRSYLRATRERFDVVVLEPLQAWSVGTSNLYSREFYQEAAAVLTDGGVVCQWIPFYGQSPRETKAMVRTALDVFPEASLWLEGADGVLVLGRRPFVLDPDLLMHRMAERGIQDDFDGEPYRRPADFLSLFLMGPRGLARYAADGAILTDDRPFLEFAAARALGADAFPAIVGSMLPDLELLSAYAPAGRAGIESLAAEAASVRWGLLKHDLVPFEDLPARAAALEEALGQSPASELLRLRYRWVMLKWGAGLPATEGRRALLDRALARDPGLGEYTLGLAAYHLSRRERVRAHALLELAVEMPPVADRARQVIGARTEPPTDHP